MDPARDPRPAARPSLRAALRRRALRRLRPPRTLRPTRAGWCFFGLTFGVGFAALNTGNNLLYLVLSLMLAFLVLSGVLSESALRGIQVRRRLPRELFAETPCHVGLEIRNTQRRAAAFAVVVEDLTCEADGVPRPVGRCFALRIGAQQRELRSYRLVPGARGRLRFRGFRVYTRFPFGLFSKALALEASALALVYPGVEPIPTPARLGGVRRGEESPSHGVAVGSVAAGLRDFAPGDPVRRIHWRTSLRKGALLVRELESECEREVEVRLRTAGTRPGASFEQGVGWAASEVVAWLDAGARVSLCTDTRSLPGRAGDRQRAELLTFLALIEPEAA